MPIDHETVKAHLEEELGVDTDDVEADTPLFSSGIVDSFALMALIAFLEDHTGLQFEAGDVTLENFDTLSRITSFLARVESKR